MKTIASLLLVCLLGLVLGGCVSRFATPPDLGSIRLDLAGSSKVAVERTWLERRASRVAVAGTVRRQPAARDTLGTTLVVDLLDASGAVLRVVPGGFTPRRLERHQSHPPIGYFRIELGDLPAGLAAIRVRAIELPHASGI